MTRTADLPADTARKMVAAHLVGLSYWADHPAASHIWAVDEHRVAHVVRVSKKDGTAQHVCNRYAAHNVSEGWCQGDDRIMSVTDPATVASDQGVRRFDVTANLLGFAPLPEPAQDDEVAQDAPVVQGDDDQPVLVAGERCPGYGQVVEGEGRRARCPHCGSSVKRYQSGKLGSHRVPARAAA